MNRSSLTLALAAVAAGACALSAQSVTTDPVGFTTLTIKGNAFSVVGLNMVKPVSYQGVVSGVSGSTITDSNANFTTALTAGKKYFVEVISGDYAGLNAEITSFSGNTITIDGDVSAVAAALNGAGHRIREVFTIGDVFGATNSAGLQGGANSGTADLIYAYNPATGGFDIFYYQSGAIIGGTGWRSTSSVFTNQADFGLYFTDGLIVQRRAATDVSIKLVGAVKTGRTLVALRNGFNLIANPYPVTDFTLGASGLFAATGGSVAGGANSNAADLVYVSNGSGGFNIYYYQSGAIIGGTGWRSTSSVFTDASTQAIGIGTSFFVQRRGAATSVALNPTF